MKDTYVQCSLNLDQAYQMAWIPKRGAKVGNQVELLPSHQLWWVVKVYGEVEMPEDILNHFKTLNRGSLPSVERMGR